MDFEKKKLFFKEFLTWHDNGVWQIIVASLGDDDDSDVDDDGDGVTAVHAAAS